VNWTEDDSHSTVLTRLKIKDDQPVSSRIFLRVECKDGEIGNYRLDERDDEPLPDWYTEHEGIYRDRCGYILGKLNPVHDELVCVEKEYSDYMDNTRLEYRNKCDELAKIYLISAMNMGSFAKIDKQMKALSTKRDTSIAAYDAKYDVLLASRMNRMSQILGYVKEESNA
jgi:hypothetical protein